MTDRTAEQRKADDALTEAIETTAKVYDVIDAEQVAMTYVVVGYAQGLGDVGTGFQFFQLYKDNGTSSTPFTHEGLLREGVRVLLGRDED